MDDVQQQISLIWGMLIKLSVWKAKLKTDGQVQQSYQGKSSRPQLGTLLSHL